MPFPPLARVRRIFDPRHVDDVAGTVRRELERALPGVPPGAPIAVGSRGIRDIRANVRETVRFLKTRGEVLDEKRDRELFEELGGFEDALDASGALVPFGG